MGGVANGCVISVADKSLINTRNKIGPKMLTCGTPNNMALLGP